MQTFLRSNPVYRRFHKPPLLLLFTLSDVAKALGIRRSSATYYVASGRLVPVSRTASGVPLFSEQAARALIVRQGKAPEKRKSYRSGLKGRRAARRKK